MKSFSAKNKSLFPYFGVVIVFILSRVFYDQAGIRFQGDTYLGYWQFIDPLLLKTDLLRSVFYLHSQPPLLNLFTGIVLQVFPTIHTEVFHILYFITGLILASALYALGIKFQFSPWLSAVLSAGFVISPGTVLYEHWLSYTYPLATMLTLAGVSLYQFQHTQKNYWGFIFFSLLAAIALTWSLFHIVWFYFIAVFVYILSSSKKKVVLTALLPMIIVTGWYAKNLIQVGEFTASSWAGMNISKIATFRIPEEDRKQMVKSGELSKFALILPFRNPSAYLKLLPDTPVTGIPVLDEPETSRGNRNHHHIVYVEASNNYLKDALHVIFVRPNSYARSVAQAMYIYFHSASDFDLLGNQAPTQKVDIWWNRVFYWQWESYETSVERNVNVSGLHIGWGIVLAFLTSMAGTANFLWKRLGQLTEPANLLVLFMAFNILFVTVVGNLMDIGENNRFRYVIDPFLLILFVFFLKNAASKFLASPKSRLSGKKLY